MSQPEKPEQTNFGPPPVDPNNIRFQVNAITTFLKENVWKKPETTPTEEPGKTP